MPFREDNYVEPDEGGGGVGGSWINDYRGINSPIEPQQKEHLITGRNRESED